MSAGEKSTICSVCSRDPYTVEFCSPEEHTETVQRLAWALGKSLAGPPGHPEDHPEWYVDDAASIAHHVAEGAGWVIEHDPGCLGEYFTVNDVEFWLDMNADGHATPELAADHRAWLAEDADDDEEEEGTRRDQW